MPAEESGEALQHAQTNSARATFFVADSVLKRLHWRIDYVLTLPCPTIGTAESNDSSPPRGRRGTSAGMCEPIEEE